MKILHCADIHLDSKLNAHLDGEKRKERKAEILRTFIRMVEYAKEEKIPVILIAGDLFDTDTVSKTAANAVYNSILANPEIDFYYLRGNHDANSFLAGMEEVPKNLFTFGESLTSYKLGTTDKGDIILSGVELGAENSTGLYNSLILNNRDYNIVMLHGQLSGYIAKGKAENIALSELKGKSIDYLALGHVHAPCKEAFDARGTFVYPGCLEGRGFDECGDHGFYVLTIDEETGMGDSQFVDFATRKIYAPVIDVTDCAHSDEMVQRIQKQLERAAIPANSLVKIILQGELDVESEKNVTYIQSRFALDYYFVKVEDETKLKLDYHIYEHDASLKGEFIRTVMASEELDTEEKGQIIRMGLLALAGEDITE